MDGDGAIRWQMPTAGHLELEEASSSSDGLPHRTAHTKTTAMGWGRNGRGRGIYAVQLRY